MPDEKETSSVNEEEVMNYYGFSGPFRKIQLKAKLLRSWILHSIAYSSPQSTFVVKLQRSRGVKIGKNCHISPYVLIDLVYPSLVNIGENVTIGSNVMIFAHSNPTANLFLKKEKYPRKTAQITIKSGAVLNPGCIITSGITIGENSMISVGSVVTQDIPDYCIAVGNPARVVKKIDE